ncbi:MAG: M1 family metallopeptidase [Planctomycetota bacterium]
MLTFVICAWLLVAADPEPLEIVAYDLALEIEPDAREIHGEARLELHAVAGSVEEARLSLNRLLTISAIESQGKPVAFKDGKEIAEGREVTLTLKPPVRKGERREFVIKYRGKALDPGPEDPDWMGVLLVRAVEIRMSHQAQWYPVLPRDDRAMSILSAPMKLKLTLPAGLESLGPGELRGRKASANGREVHEWESKRAIKGSILAGKYVAQTVKDGALQVRALAFEEHQAGAKLWAKAALEALKSLEARFGKVQNATYGIAEMRVRNRKRSYNYEADGFSVYDAVLFDGREARIEKVAHEVAHLWWGGQVNASGRGERFLKESLAEMSAYLFIEEARGVANANELAKGWLERYQNNPGAEDAIADATFRSARYSEVIYAKGPLALRALRERIGAERFDRGLAAFAAKFAGKAPMLDDFIKTMRGSGGDAVTAWASEWLTTTGMPKSATPTPSPK